MNSVALSFAALLLTAPTGFPTVDGQFVSSEVGQQALQNGTALLIDGVLVGDFSLRVEPTRR